MHGQVPLSDSLSNRRHHRVVLNFDRYCRQWSSRPSLLQKQASRLCSRQEHLFLQRLIPLKEGKAKYVLIDFLVMAPGKYEHAIEDKFEIQLGLDHLRVSFDIFYVSLIR